MHETEKRARALIAQVEGADAGEDLVQRRLEHMVSLQQFYRTVLRAESMLNTIGVEVRPVVGLVYHVEFGAKAYGRLISNTLSVDWQGLMKQKDILARERARVLRIGDEIIAKIEELGREAKEARSTTKRRSRHDA